MIVMLDILNNQFYLYTYLEYVENCSSIQDFVENNGYNLNYICIGKIHAGNDSTLLVASNTKEYRMIFIKHSINSENNIHLVGNDQYIIVYDDLIINIGEPNTRNEINNLLATYGEEVIVKICSQPSKHINTSMSYDPTSTNVQNIKHITTRSNLIIPYTIIFQTASIINLEYIDHNQIILPPNIKEVEILYYKNGEYERIGSLPSNLYSLTIRLSYLKDNRLLPKDLHTLQIVGSDHVNLEFLPVPLRKLILNVAKTQQLLPNILPKNLRKLIFGQYFDNEIELNVIPESVRFITFGCYFNKAIKPFSLPKHLHTLIFGTRFNQYLAPLSLPKHLHTLTFGSDFNKDLAPFSLPKHLHTLTFGSSFEKLIKCNVLPQHLHTLTFGESFNWMIDRNVLPPDLHTLIFGHDYNTRIDRNVLPKKLNTLVFGDSYNKQLGFDITLHGDISYLPDSLQVLEFGCEYNQRIYALPPNLITLKFGASYNTPMIINVLPKTLENLIFGLKYDCSLSLVMDKDTKVFGLPPALKTLVLGPYFKQPFYDKMIPNTIEKITLPKRYIGMQLENLFNIVYV
jgi:hypothetical protein